MTIAIVKDTITVELVGSGVYSVSALVTSSTREEGKTVSVLWSDVTDTAGLQTALTTAYNNVVSNSALTFKGQIMEAIGTDMAITEPSPSAEMTMTINAGTVTVNSGGI